MSNCADCKYDYFNWCEKRPMENGTPCKGCKMFDYGCICNKYSTCDECPHFVQQEEQDEVDRD